MLTKQHRNVFRGLALISTGGSATVVHFIFHLVEDHTTPWQVFRFRPKSRSGLWEAHYAEVGVRWSRNAV